jgi:hypothetical protein
MSAARAHCLPAPAARNHPPFTVPSNDCWFRPPDLLNHITLRLKDGTTQVDHILVSRFVVFVIASLRKLQFPLDRLEARLFTQRIKERINL